MFRIKKKEHHLNGVPESNLGRITVDNKLPGVCVSVLSVESNLVTSFQKVIRKALTNWMISC